VNGEYLLGLDPYNFNTEEEFIRFYHPELLEEEIRSYENDEDIIKENFYEG
jgi:hypothetical protein